MTEYEGEIFIDGVDCKEIGLHDLRKKITIIPQEPGNFDLFFFLNFPLSFLTYFYFSSIHGHNQKQPRSYRCIRRS